MREKDIEEMIEDISEAANLEGSEIGEYWQALVNFSQFVYYGPSDEFISAFNKEVKEQHSYIKDEFEIIDEDIVVPERKVVRKRLRMIGDE